MPATIHDIQYAKIPLAAISKDPDNLPCKEQASVRAFMRKWLSRPRDLMICGDPLAGKTWVAGRLATELVLKEAGNVLYTTMAEMVSNVLDHKGFYSEYTHGIDYLFIDNINAEKNAYAPSLLGKVYRERKDAEQITVMVTSLGAEEFRAVYTDELYAQLTLMRTLRLEVSEKALERLREEDDRHYAEEV